VTVEKTLSSVRNITKLSTVQPILLKHLIKSHFIDLLQMWKSMKKIFHSVSLAYFIYHSYYWVKLNEDHPKL
jgi:hypothetical protein